MKKEYKVQWLDDCGCWNTVERYSHIDNALQRFSDECSRDPSLKHRMVVTTYVEIATYSGDPNGDGSHVEGAY